MLAYRQTDRQTGLLQYSAIRVGHVLVSAQRMPHDRPIECERSIKQYRPRLYCIV